MDCPALNSDRYFAQQSGSVCLRIPWIVHLVFCAKYHGKFIARQLYLAVTYIYLFQRLASQLVSVQLCLLFVQLYKQLQLLYMYAFCLHAWLILNATIYIHNQLSIIIQICCQLASQPGSYPCMNYTSTQLNNYIIYVEM